MEHVTLHPQCHKEADELTPDRETVHDHDVYQNVQDMTEAADHGEDIFEQFQAKYELRPVSRESKSGFTSTWMDQDDTGDYDPREEARKDRLRRQKLKLQRRKHVSVTADSPDEETVNPKPIPKELPQLIVQLKFATHASKAGLEQILSAAPAKSESACDDFFNGYKLRRKSTGAGSYSDGSSYDRGSATISGLPEDLTGHPAARGCWECLALALRCPLLDDERAWPCATCVADGHDCDLVTPPAEKRACERCKRRRTGCSYTYTLNHDEPCHQCADEGHRCVAGPAKGSIRTRIRYDRDWIHDPSPAPKKPAGSEEVWSCMQCREARRECSFSTGGIGEDCTACEMIDNLCIPEKISTSMPQHRSLQAPVSHRCKKTARRTSDTEMAPAKRAKKASAKTSEANHATFGNMVAFNVEEVAEPKPCHFCDGSAFPIRGLDALNVGVNGHEINPRPTNAKDGHVAEGQGQNRMCMPCTMERVAIIMCKQHKLRPIADVSEDTLDYDGALTALFAGTPRKKDRWCSLCPTLALHECTAEQSIQDPDSSAHGCGLLLCELCFLQLEGMYHGDLQAMLGGLGDESTNERPLGLRADSELLKEDGRLMVSVRQASQQ